MTFDGLNSIFFSLTRNESFVKHVVKFHLV